jgi:F-type H+-transporting ATPase subunit gamma
MQMVAAAKLRRAQEAAEAARPYAERMGAVLANLAVAIRRRDDAPKLMSGTGKDEVHLLVVAPPNAVCAAASTPTSPSWRASGGSLIGQGKTVKIMCVGKKGYDALKRELAST